MKDVGVQKSRREQAPILSAQREGPDVCSPVGNVQPGYLLKDENNHVHRNQTGGHGKAAKIGSTHAASRTARRHSGTAVAQDGCYAFFIHRKWSAAFQTTRHIGYRITRKLQLWVSRDYRRLPEGLMVDLCSALSSTRVVSYRMSMQRG